MKTQLVSVILMETKKYILYKLPFKKEKYGNVARTLNPITEEAQASSSLWVQGQLVLLDSQSYVDRPCLHKPKREVEAART